MDGLKNSPFIPNFSPEMMKMAQDMMKKNPPTPEMMKMAQDMMKKNPPTPEMMKMAQDMMKNNPPTPEMIKLRKEMMEKNPPTPEMKKMAQDMMKKFQPTSEMIKTEEKKIDKNKLISENSVITDSTNKNENIPISEMMIKNPPTPEMMKMAQEMMDNISEDDFDKFINYSSKIKNSDNNFIINEPIDSKKVFKTFKFFNKILSFFMNINWSYVKYIIVYSFLSYIVLISEN